MTETKEPEKNDAIAEAVTGIVKAKPTPAIKDAKGSIRLNLKRDNQDIKEKLTQLRADLKSCK